MATRRSLAALCRRLRPQIPASPTPQTLTLAAPKPSLIPRNLLRSRLSLNLIQFFGGKSFSSKPTDPLDDDNLTKDDDDSDEDDLHDDHLDEDDEDVDDDDVDDDDVDDGEVYGSRSVAQSGKSEEERRSEAKEIGYEVISRLDSSENPFKPYEPVFAVVQIGSHQFKVSNGDSIFTERLKYCDVNDKLILNKVMMLGSRTQTIIGRPTLPDATVHAVVEEHALDAKVIIFKKKRRKNYRRTKGHRQELTKLRITDIQGVDKSEGVPFSA